MWAALAALLAALGLVLGRSERLLGPSRASREGPRRLAGELREVILGRIFKVDPQSLEKSQCFDMFSCLIAYIVGAVWGRLLPSLWRARCRRVP